jgi:hypothetical protein
VGKRIKLKDQDRYVRHANKATASLSNIEDWFLESAVCVPEYQDLAHRARILLAELHDLNASALRLAGGNGDKAVKVDMRPAKK